MPSEEKSNNFLIIIGVGILIGAAFVYSAMKQQQLLSEAAAQAAAAQASAQQMYLENLSSAMKRLEGKVQVQTLQPPYPPILQPLKLLAPELIESLKPTTTEMTAEAPAASYKNNESWEFKRGPDQTITIGDKTITVPGPLQFLNVIRNAKTNT